MVWIANWSPMIVTMVARVIFFLFMRDFRGERFLQSQEEHTKQLKHHTALLERIAVALENATGIKR
jgi:uncharacterized membrane protein (DUF106 family)